MFMRFDEITKIRSSTFKQIPLDCPVCGTMLKTSDITESFDEYGCCEECKFSFAETNMEKWRSGWRPTKKQVDRVLKNRAKLPTYTVRG